MNNTSQALLVPSEAKVHRITTHVDLEWNENATSQSILGNKVNYSVLSSMTDRRVVTDGLLPKIVPVKLEKYCSLADGMESWSAWWWLLVVVGVSVIDPDKKCSYKLGRQQLQVGDSAGGTWQRQSVTGLVKETAIW
ncbi:hypothetical protein Pint_14629 [Pistacia integerrima]|uniref:Uncharacterized protein n=1 Tax=Pistacia integerrima TaxID=434235 RepID=A0ACC0Y6E2_9ROSI|nr:hypothetical protein Pint_14629 [Pistacia integerrima]